MKVQQVLSDGSWVVGFFLDGGEAQQPLVLGSLGGYATKPKNLGFEDALRLGKHWLQGCSSRRESNKSCLSQTTTSSEKKEDKFGKGLGGEITEESYVEKYPSRKNKTIQQQCVLQEALSDERNFLSEEESINTSIGLTNHLPKEPLGSKMDQSES